MNNTVKWIIAVIIVVAIVWFGFMNKTENQISGEVVKIGIITPLTGGVAYWGESSQIGIELAKKDLLEEGFNFELIIEDGQLDPKVALNAAQKLVNVDGVDAIYSEFNPAAISVSSFLKGKNILHLYNAAPVSPLEDGNNIYKVYLDYEESCRETANVAKSRGLNKIGVLKINLEFGDLCLSGIKDVYGENSLFVEDYNPGETDFRTHLLKLKNNGVEAIFNASFQPETLASLKNLRETGSEAVFIGLSEIVSPDIINDYSNSLEGSIMFGLPAVDQRFVDKIGAEFINKTIGSYQAVALAYTHVKQLVYALDGCDGDMQCINKKMDKSKSEDVVGFVRFNNHIAEFDTLIQEWKDGKFVDIK